MADTSRTRFLVNAWYQKAYWLYLLWPLTFLYRSVMMLRRAGYKQSILKTWKAPIPVIVVGNITVGGTGKTPLVIALVKELQAEGFNPAIVSRGYGSNAPYYPFLVTFDTPVGQAGDEPLLLAIRTQVPVIIGANRVLAVQTLLNNHACDVIISDDGLQHYALGRDIELVVVDGQRVFGNQLCLPAGPLREPVNRIESSDFIISNGTLSDVFDTSVDIFTMKLNAVGFVPVLNDKQDRPIDLSRWSLSMQVHAVAGIGNPGRFFDDLRRMGFTVIEHVFDDHHQYCVSDLVFYDNLPIMMTEKDAVKVRKLEKALDLTKFWYVPINAAVDKDLFTLVIERIKALLVN